ncbi:MAG: MFS transporter [Thermoplasmata archaeon]
MDNEDKEEYEIEVVEGEVVEEVKEGVPVEAEVVESPQPEGEKKGFFGQFPHQFWWVNSLELFERGAFYGMMAFLAVHVTTNVGIPTPIWGLLFALLYFLLYFTPLVSAALAEKYGYKLVLLVSLGTLMVGYFLTFTVRMGQLPFLVFTIILIGLGAGAFKPMISATIAHITEERQRNLAFSLYYWFINLGATIIPGFLALLFFFIFIGTGNYSLIFIVAGVLIAIALAIVFIKYQNPVEPKRDISISNALKKIIPALKDKKFMILCIIYSGFWFMYTVNLAILPKYMFDFRRMPDWFNPGFLGIINPFTIIIVGPFLGKLVEKHKSLRVMMIGIIIALTGITIVFLSNNSALFVTGIIIFSIGEFVTHPGFIAYISKIAPKDKVAIYMAVIFIPTGIGAIVGGAVQGALYAIYAEGLHTPKLFGAIVPAIGLLTIGCLILYNRWINKLAKEEDAFYEEDKSIWTKMTTSAVAFMFIPIIIGVGYMGGTDIFYGIGEEEGTGTTTDWSKYEIVAGNPITMSGYSDENSDTLVTGLIKEENLISMNLTLTWTDEPDEQYGLRTYENEPDTFSLRVETPDGNEYREGPESNAHGETGEIILTITFDPDIDPYLNGTGQYNITIECGDCGDLFTTGLIGFTDTGNDWDLLIEYEYYFKEE